MLPGRRTARWTAWWTGARVALVVLVLISAGWAVQDESGRRPAVATEAAAPITGTATGTETRGGAGTLAYPAPVSLRIPAIGIVAALGALGLNPDHTVQVPARPQQPGWYRLGPSPGQLGSAVILGHLDSTTGPAVFYRLRSLRKGDAVAVTLADRSVAHFVVTRMATYANARFPAQLVYGSSGGAALQLVTCGGTYDHQAKSYRANLVAFTSLTSVTPAPWLPELPGGLLSERA